MTMTATRMESEMEQERTASAAEVRRLKALAHEAFFERRPSEEAYDACKKWGDAHQQHVAKFGDDGMHR